MSEVKPIKFIFRLTPQCIGYLRFALITTTWRRFLTIIEINVLSDLRSRRYHISFIGFFDLCSSFWGSWESVLPEAFSTGGVVPGGGGGGLLLGGGGGFVIPGGSFSGASKYVDGAGTVVSGYGPVWWRGGPVGTGCEGGGGGAAVKPAKWIGWSRPIGAALAGGACIRRKNIWLVHRVRFNHNTEKENKPLQGVNFSNNLIFYDRLSRSSIIQTRNLVIFAHEVITRKIRKILNGFAFLTSVSTAYYQMVVLKTLH